MNKLFIIILIFILACSGKQVNNNTSKPSDTIFSAIQTSADTLKGKILNDTFFILRETKNNIYHAIYIEKNKQSEYYTRLTDFKFSEYDMESINANYQLFKEKYSKKWKKNKLYDLARDWLPLYMYKNKYYLYAPSDWGNARKRIITDSTFVCWFMDGPYPEPLENVKKINANKYELISRNPFDQDSLSTLLIIYVIDAKSKITVWEYPNESELYRYQFYIPKEYAKNFDIIVNYCKDRKQMEFEFDKVDYEKLLSNY